MSIEIDYEVEDTTVEIEISDFCLIASVFESEEHLITPYVDRVLRDCNTLVEDIIKVALFERFGDVKIEAVDGNATLTLGWKASEDTVTVDAYLSDSYYSRDRVEITLELGYAFDADIVTEIEDWFERDVKQFLDECYCDAINGAFERFTEDSIMLWDLDDAAERVEHVTEQCKAFNVAYVPTAAELDDIEELSCFYDGDWITTDTMNYSIDTDCDRMLDRLEWAVENTSMLYASGNTKITEKRLAVATTEEEVAKGNAYIYFELAAALEADLFSDAA